MSARPPLIPLPLALISFSLLLSSCSTLLGFTPERAVVREILQTGDPNFSILPDSVQVLQSVKWNEAVLVMVAYQRSAKSNQIENCLDMYSAELASGSWRASAGGGGCMTAGAVHQPLDMAGSSTDVANGPALSYTYGQIYDPKIAQVQVTWSDKQIQTVEVVNGSYLAVRSESVFYEEVHALDAGGGILFTFPFSEIPPGKAYP